MTFIRSFARIATVALAIAVIAVPGFAATGSANFKTVVAIGDSYGAGFESNSLNEHHSVFSWPAIVARQLGIPLCTIGSSATDNCFAQPIVSYPGIGPELTLMDISTYPPVIVNAPGSGAPLNTTFGRPFNNVSIPGANVADTFTVTGAVAKPTRGVEQLAQFILRGPVTEVDSVVAQKPTFVLVWIGGNDFLGSATNGTTAGLTPLATFTAAYNTMLDRLVATGAGVVVGTLPTNPVSVPFFKTVPTVLINPTTRTPVLGPTGQPITLVGQIDAAPGVGQLQAGSLITLGASSLLAQGFGIPSALKPLLDPNNKLPLFGTPLPDAVILTPAEQTALVARIADYNTAIVASAAAHNVPVADIKGLFDRFATGLNVGPFHLTSDFITGGLFSLDGVHLSDIGYTLFANEYIKAINSGYGTHVPLASVAKFMQNNDPATQMASGAAAYPGMMWIMSDEASKSLAQMFAVTSTPSSSRRRALH
ncbi:MAG TPA: SGNH/GDSL hydrolase family protein [Thermoanaerobaculia bacterium]|jgi:lysophospholipase L1-like esterase|nr:SGNH/GDSL hydrolase family protein [Thermoanaerobaculia bacterium]